MRPGPGGSLVPKLYRLFSKLLPPSVRKADGEEIQRAFQDLWEDAEGLRRRTRIAFRAFGALPGVVVMEWLSLLTPGRGTPAYSASRRWALFSMSLIGPPAR